MSVLTYTYPPAVRFPVRPMTLDIRQLRQLMRLKEGERPSISSGCLLLDRLLPQQGFQRGSLVEWIGSGAGSGDSLLAMLAAQSACRDGGALVLVDRMESFYPPAAKACQLDLHTVTVVHPASENDECWALEQALRCPDVAAVLGWPKRLTSNAFRRLQLAAEQGGGLGLLVRPASTRRESSWASVRMAVSPRVVPQSAGRQGWQLGVELLRCSGVFGTKQIEFEIDDQTGEVRDAYPRPLAAQLAGTTPGPRKARA